MSIWLIFRTKIHRLLRLRGLNPVAKKIVRAEAQEWDRRLLVPPQVADALVEEVRGMTFERYPKGKCVGRLR